MAEKLIGELEILPGEDRIAQLGGLQLTNKRVAYAAEVKRGSETNAAMVRDIDSVAIGAKRPSLTLIIFGIILAIAGIGLLASKPGLGVIPLIIGIVLIVLFFLLKKRTLRLTIAGQNWLALSVQKLGAETEIVGFVNKFFEVKDKVSGH